MSNDLLLRKYNPVSQLSTPKHDVQRPKFPAFDIHTHFGPMVMGENYAEKYDTGRIVRALKDIGVFGVCNLDLIWNGALERQLAKLDGYGDFILTFASVDIGRMEDVDFAAYVDDTLRRYKATGIRGLKLWKNLGLGLRDSSGHYITVDDDRLRPIWESAAKHELPILIHIADPKSFFTPVDDKNEYYECLCDMPEWSFCGDGLYSFDELMEKQDIMLSQNSHTTYIVAHVGSCAEDLAYVGNQLDSHSNMYVDTAARISELGRQPYTAREFFIKYQDRILFGTDYSCYDVKEIYPYYYRFFETFDEYFRYGPDDGGYDMGRWNIYGIGLPDDVLEKLYAKNARRLLGIKD